MGGNGRRQMEHHQTDSRNLLDRTEIRRPRARCLRDWEERMTLADAARMGVRAAATSGRTALLLRAHPVSVSWERQDGALECTAVSVRPHGRRCGESWNMTAGYCLKGNGRGGACDPRQRPNVSGQAAFRAAAIDRVAMEHYGNSLPPPMRRHGIGRARRRLLIAGLAVFAMRLEPWVVF